MPSISISKGKGNIKHNLRKQTQAPQNVDHERTHLNVTLINKDIHAVYHEFFDDCVQSYNEEQVKKGHAERQIKDYYKKILHDKKTKTFHELVIQVGNKDDNMPVETTNAIYRSYLSKFQHDNPNFVVIGAYIHNDEATPHMHLDYIPVAKYGRGQKLRVANDRAIKQMKFKSWDSWHEAQMRGFEQVINKHGLEREIMNDDRKHVENVSQFKAQAQAIERLAKKEIEKITVPEPEIKTNPFTKKQTVVLSVDEYNDLVRNYELHKASYEAQKRVLTADKEKIESEFEKLKNKPYVVENKRLSGEVYGLAFQIVDYEWKGKQLNEELISLKNKRDELMSQNDKLNSQLYDMQFELSKKNLAITDYQHELNKIIEQYKELKSQSSVEHLKSLESEVASLTTENKRLNTVIQNQSNELQNVKAENQEQHKMLARLEDRNYALHDEIKALKNQLKEEVEKIRNQFIDQINQLEKTVLNLKQRMYGLANHLNAVRSTIDYVRCFFSEGTGQAILDGTIKAIHEYAAEEGVADYMTEHRTICDTVLENMPDIGYTYKYGHEGKGIYDTNNELVLPVDSYREAKELMPNVQIRDGRDRGIER